LGNKIRFGILTLSFFLFFLFFVRAEVPAFPCSFYGGLIVNGESAKIGSEIIAKIDGIERGRIIINKVGEYGGVEGSEPKLMISGSSSDNGKDVEFYVNNVKLDQTGIWESGEVINLDLTGNVGTQDNGGNDDEDEDDDWRSRKKRKKDDEDEVINQDNGEKDNNDKGNEDFRREDIPPIKININGKIRYPIMLMSVTLGLLIGIVGLAIYSVLRK